MGAGLNSTDRTTPYGGLPYNKTILLAMESSHALGGLGFLAIFAARTPLSIFAYQPTSNRVLYLNQAFEKLFGTSMARVMAEPGSLLELVHPDDRSYLTQAYQRLSTKPDAAEEIEFRLQAAGEAERWIQLSCMAIEESNRPTVLTGFAQEITSRKAHDQVERKFMAQKNALLEVLSHDLSGPIINIQSLAFFSRKLVNGEENEKLAYYIDLIEQTAKRNVQMIRTFVKQEALENEKAALAKERFDVVERIKHPIEQLQASENYMSKTFHLHSSSPAIYLDLDEVKFLQAITNLLSNAIKFTPDEGVITVNVQEQERHVLVSVADNGIGISEQYFPILFNRFTRARRPGLRGEDSFGLGLSIVKAIVDMHQGRIWLESQEGKGTTFFIELPKP
jgi:two-component system sensor histidine kinase VicK